ncbi:MAG TPA: ankyrin repeat domain-containing protein [Bryobacteraceae bacterium]|jgi:ankyrin repeat protein|nr:ankyrin repeat domain-containing protein [Bryobacteraceae bacterium]
MKQSALVLLTFSFAGFSYAADSAVADAAQNRDTTALQALLKKHTPVNVPQADGTTALQWAAHWNDADAVNILIAAGAGAKAANRYGATPLSEAAALGNANIMEALLKAGADPNSRDTADGETVLMVTARSGNADAVRALLDHKADVNATETYRGQTALMWAAAERHPEVVRLLLQHGADWKTMSSYRETRLPKLSAASSVTPFARGGFTAFLFTAREGDIETAKVMLDAGIDINQTDVDGTSGLVVSIMNKQYTFAKFLLDRGANPNVTDVKGRAALYAAVDMRNEDWSALPSRKLEDPYPSLDLIQAIIARGAKVNAPLTKNLPGRSGMDGGDTTLDEGTTPFMRAARSGDAATMRLLLKAGADPRLTTKEGNNALMFAAGVGYRDKNTRGSESEALEALKVCVDQSMDLNQKNARGETALHGAASRGADTIVQYLVAHGAKMDAKSGRGFTPLDIALGKDSFSLPVPHDSTVTLIRSLGGVESAH